MKFKKEIKDSIELMLRYKLCCDIRSIKQKGKASKLYWWFGSSSDRPHSKKLNELGQSVDIAKNVKNKNCYSKYEAQLAFFLELHNNSEFRSKVIGVLEEKKKTSKIKIDKYVDEQDISVMLSTYVNSVIFDDLKK